MATKVTLIQILRPRALQQEWGKPIFYGWAGALAIALLVGLPLRFWDLGNPLVEPQPIRQTQTALTAVMLSQGRTQFWNYASPYEGKLWNFVHEFPLYQLLVSGAIRLGVPLEWAARLVTLAAFFSGLYLFLLLVHQFLGSRVVPWALLLYLLSPFGLVYSRVCLVDVFALALLLGSYVCALHPDVNKRKWLLAGAFLLGSLSGTVKTNVWFAPTVFYGVWHAWQWIRPANGTERAKASLHLIQGAGQLIAVILWIRWTMHLRGQTGLVVGQDTSAWIIGPFYGRFLIAPWHSILHAWVRSVWGDWMLIPGLVAFASPFRGRALFCLGVTLLSILATFGVHAHHDYYLLGEFPYLMAIPAMGLAALVSGRAVRSNRALASKFLLTATAVFFLVRLPKLRYFFEPIFFDYRSGLSGALHLKELTDKEDLVYVAATPEAWGIPLYAKRDVILSPYFKDSRLEPTVFYIPDGDYVDVLATASNYWIEGTKEGFGVARVKVVRGSARSPGGNIWVGDNPTSFSGAGQTVVPGRPIDTCANERWLRLAIPTTEKTFILMAGTQSFRLPARAYLHLPNRTPWGCHFRVQSESRNTASSKADM